MSLLRIVRGLGSLLVLAVGLIAVPIALILVATTLIPDSLSFSAALGSLLRPDDGSVVLRLLLLVAAVAWLVFAVSAVAEIIGFVSGYRISVKLPGLGGPQRLVAGLLLGVVAMVAVPHAPAQGAPVAQHAPVAPAQARAEVPRQAPAAEESETATGTHDARHRVELGDDLWSLAEHYYGNGREWRRIAAANPAQLTGGPDRLQVGWQLLIPDAPRRAAASPPGDRVVVVSGDTLSSIAEHRLGDESRWQEIYDANRAQLDDPDELRVGMTLLLPDSDQQSPRRSSAPPPAPPAPAADDEPPVEAAPDQAAPDEAEPNEAAPDEAEPDEAEPPVPAASADRHERASGGSSGRDLPVASPGPAEAPATVPTQAEAPTANQPPTEVGDGDGASDVDWQLAGSLAGVGGLLAAAFTGGLVARRRLQLQARPLGRRIPQPGAEARRVEATLGRRARPLTVRSLDLALRAVSAQAFRTGAVPPRLRYVRVADDAITLQLDEPGGLPPRGFTVDGSRWVLDRAGVPELRGVPGLAQAPRPYPALVTLGVEESGATVMLDLEAVGLVGLATSDPEVAAACLVALATELAFAPAADEMFLTLVGGSAELAEALGKHNVTCTQDVDGLLHRLETRGREQRRVAPEGPAGYRIDPDLADPWAPEVVLIAAEITADQSRRLAVLITAEPPITLAAVLVNPSVPCEATLRIEAGGSAAVLEPAGIQLRAQQVGPAAAPALVELVQVSGQEETTVAPWWSGEPPDPPPDGSTPSNVAYLSRRAEAWAARSTDSQREEVAQMIASIESGATPAHPVLRLLGPVELDGAAGVLPPRAAKQCLEYCGWLLEHPGSTAPQMTAALAVAEGTRRSNMSRLRAWLGSNAAGEPYLPDAYTGRISLDQAVSSDWHWLQIFTAGGVVRAGDDALHAALGLVRGAPLADAAPGQWHWAEELRTDMISAVRDIGVELARRSLEDGDIDGARWAASRALLASPGDELLMVARIRTEHRAGNRAEVERLTLQVAAQARQLGIDLAEETVVVLQEVMEGRARARMA